jgi:endonuclease/exonuclease/phosphatase (EEP) superfamily protein YafD
MIGATLVYCIGLLALAALWALAGQRAWWLELSNTFALLLFTPLLAALPAALLIRSRWMAGAIALALALFGTLFGARFMPPVPPPIGGAPLRVMTFNHLRSNQRIAEIIVAIRSQRADIVGLQELSEPVANALRAELSAEYPYQELASGHPGLGLISRYPIQTAGMSSSVRGQRITVQIGRQIVTVINVHLAAPSIKIRKIPRLNLPVITGYDASAPTRQVGRLANEIDQIGGPLIVMGDFNTGDREPRYADLAARMHDAFRETNWGFGFTFPDHKRLGPITFPIPLVRIDYIWSKGGVRPAAAHVECNNTGADHCFLVAELKLVDQQASSS